MSKKTLPKVNISETFCFTTQFSSIRDTQNALSLYEKTAQEPEKWIKSENKTPLFLDTNVLLDLYSMSINDRSRIIQVFSKNKDRLYIPSQVETEFLRHRVSRIKGFSNIITELKTCSSRLFLDIKNSFDNISSRLDDLYRNKMIIGDMYRLQSKIQDIKTRYLETKPESDKESQLNALIQEFEQNLGETIERTYDTLNLEYHDPVLETISEVRILDKLEDSELDFLRTKYDQLKIKYNEVKGTDAKNSFAFPGCGDLPKEKKGFDPYGDFYIYHEIIKYMKQADTDVVFLTNDVTKEDWVRKDERPFLHYLVNTYHLTGHTLHIINAAKYLALTSSQGGIPSIGNEDDIEALPIATVTNPEAEQQLPVETTTETPTGFTSSYFKNITKEEFLENLRRKIELSKDYYDGYVGEHYFIYKALGYQHYNYRTSREILQQLIEEGLVIKETVEKEDHSFDALIIPEKDHM